MAEVVWQLHRDELSQETNSARGVLNGRGAPGQEIITLQTVENLARRIPAGHAYRCVRDYWYGGKVPTFEIIWPWDDDHDGRPDRDRLLFHWANAVRNRGGELILLGCVAPGLERVQPVWETFFPGEDLPELAQGLPGVASSRDAFQTFMEHNDGLEEFTLKVTEVPMEVTT